MRVFLLITHFPTCLKGEGMLSRWLSDRPLDKQGTRLLDSTSTKGLVQCKNKDGASRKEV